MKTSSQGFWNEPRTVIGTHLLYDSPEQEMAAWLSHPATFGQEPVYTETIYRSRMVLPAFDAHQTEFFLVRYALSAQHPVEIGFVSDMPAQSFGPEFDFSAITLKALSECYLGAYIKSYAQAFFPEKIGDFTPPTNLEEIIKDRLEQGELTEIILLDSWTAVGRTLFVAEVEYPDGEPWLLLGVLFQLDDETELFVYEFDSADAPHLQRPMDWFIGRMYNQCLY